MENVDSRELGSFPPGIRLPVARAAAGAMMPYFTTGIQSLVSRETSGLGTMGVTKQGVLMYDPELLSKLRVEEAATMILHEYLHIYLNHCARFDELVRKGILEDSDSDLWNNAADCEINDNLLEADCTFPRPEIMGGEAITPESLGLPSHLTAEQYAVTLKEKRDEPESDDSSSPPRPPKSDGDVLPACGSGSGNSLEGEPENDPDGRDEADLAVDRQTASGKIQEHVKKHGSVPGGLCRYAEAVVPRSTISWERELEAEISKAAAHKAGQADYTYSHRSRHQASFDYVYGEDAPVLPGMWAPISKVALVVDTSASMDFCFNTVISEAAGILKAIGGTRMTLVACDAKVQALEKVKSVDELRPNLLGGGGTDFRPAFTALQQLPLKDRPDVVVFATDGYGVYPSTEPSWKHIWLVVDGRVDVNWGKKIQVEI